jgi:DNA-binding NarL/FixJ family response regulator
MMAAKLLAEFRGSGIDAMAKKTAEEEANLSPREDEVLRLVAQGATNKEIADSLFISENTVKTHLRNIMDKLHLANRSQAAAYAVKRGLVPDNRK